MDYQLANALRVIGTLKQHGRLNEYDTCLLFYDICELLRESDSFTMSYQIHANGCIYYVINPKHLDASRYFLYFDSKQQPLIYTY